MPRIINVGRKTILTKELLTKIKDCVVNGKTMRDTAKICEIPESTLYTWKYGNYLNLGQLIEGWQRDYMLSRAEINLKKFLLLETEDPALLRIKQDTSKFVAQTLGKKHYSTATENKNLSVNVDIKADDVDLDKLTALLNNQLKNGDQGASFIGDGPSADIVAGEAQDADGERPTDGI